MPNLASYVATTPTLLSKVSYATAAGGLSFLSSQGGWITGVVFTSSVAGDSLTLLEGGVTGIGTFVIRSAAIPVVAMFAHPLRCNNPVLVWSTAGTGPFFITVFYAEGQ